MLLLAGHFQHSYLDEARSSVEWVVAQTATELIWIRSMLKGFGIQVKGGRHVGIPFCVPVNNVFLDQK